jgi:hypothetical protein
VAWFVHGMLDFADPTDYDVSYFSIKRTRTSQTTNNFRMVLSGKTYAVEGPLARFKTKEFAVNLVDLADRDGVSTFTASIKGNHCGLANLIYRAPLLMGRNARYRVNSVNGNSYDLMVTAPLSGSSRTFEMFPFSTKYGGVTITAEDGSGQNRTSKNKNQWIECDCSAGGKKLIVTYPATIPPR